MFYDGTLDRATDKSGKFADYTFEGLKSVKGYGNSATGFYDRMVIFLLEYNTIGEQFFVLCCQTRKKE